jgi:hypothetical protein
VARRALVLAFVLAAACGDDERVGPRPAERPAGTSSPPVAPPTAPPASPLPEPAAPRDAWAGTRAGDWATWEIRVDGSDALTRLTWRARKVDGARVEYDVESRTTSPEGRVLASQDVRAVHGGGFDAVRPRGTTPREFTVGGVRLEALHAEYDGPGGKVSVWTSDRVPFHGLVSSKGAGVEQTLVAFERAPEGR